MRGELLAVGLALFLVSSPIMAGVGTATTSEPPATMLGENGPPVTVDVTRLADGNGLRYELAISSTTGVDQLTLFVGSGARVHGTEGVERDSTGTRTRLTWDGTAQQIRVVIETTPSPTKATRSGERFTGEDWALRSVPFVQVRWRSTGDTGIHHDRPLGESVGALDDDSAGIFGDRYALLGETTTQSVTANGQRIRLVSPAGTTLAPERDEVLSAVTTASGQLAVGDRNEEVLLFALPAPARRGGESFPVRDEAWISTSEPLNSANSVWLHEYVHTRQSFQLAADMSWFREASAEYYAARLAYRQGRITEREMRAHINGTAINAALTERSTWPTSRVPYRKGTRVLALLDRNIRESTDGRRTLQDVFQRLNTHEGTVTYPDFKRIVEAVAGHPMDAWLDRYVAGTRPVASFYDHEPARSGLTGMLETTLQQGGTGLVFFVVSTLFSVVASVPLYTFLRRFEEDELRSEPSLTPLLPGR